MHTEGQSGITIIKATDGKYPLHVAADGSTVLAKGVGHWRGPLERGGYWIIPDNWKPGSTSTFVLRVAGSNAFEFEERFEADYFQVLETVGTWKHAQNDRISDLTG